MSNLSYRQPLVRVVAVAVLLLDLDDTLVDRQAAFRTWAGDFVKSLGALPSDVEWLVEADQHGYAPRELLGDAVRRRYGLQRSVDAIVDDVFTGMLAHMVLEDEVKTALVAAQDDGWLPVVVTNGRADRQEAKIRRTGLDSLVAGWVISEAVGLRKPDPRIFALGARGAGATLDEAWMVGDTPHADIVGAGLTGIGSTWISHGRAWPFCFWSEPALVAPTCSQAISGLPSRAPRPAR